MDRLQQAKCSKSPTKVHWWMIPSIGSSPTGRCKFCGNEKVFRASSGLYEWKDYAAAHHLAAELVKAQISKKL